MNPPFSYCRMDLEARAEELASDLGVDKAEVVADLQTLLEYDVPVSEAIQSLRRKYGGTGGTASVPTTSSIEAVTADLPGVSLVGTVLTRGRRTIVYDGDEQTIIEGTIGDETGRVAYTAWEDLGFSVGDTISIQNAGVREWDGEPQLNLGDTTTISPAEESLDVPFEVGGDRTLDSLETGDRGITVGVSVLECEQRTIDGRDGETTILSGVIGDETKRLPFTDWEAHTEMIEPGASVELIDCHVREHRGVPAVNIGEHTTVRQLEREVAVTDAVPELEIGEAIDAGGAFDISVVGTVIDVRDGSGLIQRCPECSRVIQNGQCRSHGSVSGEDDLRIKAVVDDGTGALMGICDRELTESVYGDTLEAAREAARDAMDRSVVTSSIVEAIVGRQYRLRGSLQIDEYGAMLTVESFDRVSTAPTELAQTALAEVGR